ncbi:MAG: T9SS type A sorting domain-containing protein [Ignavibacteria bacterium]|jgi:hypothetical protein|nr:T9SS type A sorting domain-containing protein [Ignavibacteria bacterium]
MLKRLLLVALLIAVGCSVASAQFSKAEQEFLRTPFKVKMVGDALVGVRTDGMPNTYGLPSVSSFIKKVNNGNPVYPSNWNITSTFTELPGSQTIYDLCSNGSPVMIWQNPTTPDEIHIVVVHSPAGDPQPGFAARRSKYFFSSDRGVTWTFISDVPSVRSGFPTINGFGDGTALIANHSNDGGAPGTKAQAYKDAAAGLGSFTRLDPPPIENVYIWPRLVATSNLSLSNKFVLIGSINGQDTTRFNVCTNVNSTPGTWLGWTTFQSDQAETHGIARGSDGRIGIAFKNNDGTNPGDYADVWFMESTNNGTSFSTPIKIFDANISPTGDSLGLIRGIGLVYQGTSPKVVFETIKQTTEGNFYPGLPAKIRFWSSSLPGSDPNRSIVIADTNNVGYHPYIGVNDVLSTLSRPNIGVSANGNVLFAVFMVPSDFVGGITDTTTFGDIWMTVSANNGLNWEAPAKINPVNPVKDWRYISISPTSDNSGNTYYANMVCLKGNMPGSYVNGTGNGESLEPYVFIRSTITGVGISQVSTEVPSNFSLSQNYPNPFNPTTNIKFAVSKSGFVTLKVYDMLGKEVAVLVNNNMTSGTYEYQFDASKLTSGIYFYNLKTDGFSETKKMMLIK